jgi:hypothetical protein
VPWSGHTGQRSTPKEEATGYPACAPRCPEDTAFYTLVQDHLDAFLAHVRATYARGLPRYVERAFRTYLDCGIFCHGFLRWHCDARRRDLLVAFSCKGRGVCPSCNARRMCNTAAHVTDRVLPAVPVRQWVLSLPFEIRKLCAFRADVAVAAARMFVEAIAGELRRELSRDAAEHGALVFVQRLGCSLNLNFHLHVLVLDGLFVPDEASPPGLVFHDTGRPAPEMLERVIQRVRERMVRWLRKKRLLDDRPAEERPDETAQPTALEACAEAALQHGAFTKIEADGALRADGDSRFQPKRRGPLTAEIDGFNVQAAVRIEADDDAGPWAIG